MKITRGKLIQIIREEVQNVANEARETAINRFGFGRTRYEKHGGDISVPDTELNVAGRRDAIKNGVADFLKTVNDENGGWWPETWSGHGQYYKDGKMTDRTPEQIAVPRKRFDASRKDAKRNPFTIKHIIQDLKQGNTDAWHQTNLWGEYPSLAFLLNDKLIKPLAAKMNVQTSEAKKMLQAMLSKISASQQMIKSKSTLQTEQGNQKEVETSSLEVAGVEPADAPEFSGAWFSYGKYTDGTELTDDELNDLTMDAAWAAHLNDLVYQSLV